MKILLDYFFPITSIEPTPPASTAFLRQVLVAAKPAASATENVITPCTTLAQVAALTDNDECAQLFNAGMAKIYVVAVANLTGLGAIITADPGEFYTVLISSDFSDAEIAARVMGTYGGVIGLYSNVGATNAARAILPKTVAFYGSTTNKAKNMFFAFGKLLSNTFAWRNQQYITMPFADDVTTLGGAVTLFNEKVSFVISDVEFGNRLALFAVAQKAIVAPYVTKNLEVDMQSSALSYISGNQPSYTVKQAALVEDELQKVIQKYVNDESIEKGTVSVTLANQNFVASAGINISEPKALWRINGELRQTL